MAYRLFSFRLFVFFLNTFFLKKNTKEEIHYVFTFWIDFPSKNRQSISYGVRGIVFSIEREGRSDIKTEYGKDKKLQNNIVYFIKWVTSDFTSEELKISMDVYNFKFFNVKIKKLFKTF